RSPAVSCSNSAAANSWLSVPNSIGTPAVGGETQRCVDVAPGGSGRRHQDRRGHPGLLGPMSGVPPLNRAWTHPDCGSSETHGTVWHRTTRHSPCFLLTLTVSTRSKRANGSARPFVPSCRSTCFNACSGCLTERQPRNCGLGHRRDQLSP